MVVAWHGMYGMYSNEGRDGRARWKGMESSPMLVSVTVTVSVTVVPL